MSPDMLSPRVIISNLVADRLESPLLLGRPLGLCSKEPVRQSCGTQNNHEVWPVGCQGDGFPSPISSSIVVGHQGNCSFKDSTGSPLLFLEKMSSSRRRRMASGERPWFQQHARIKEEEREMDG